MSASTSKKARKAAAALGLSEQEKQAQIAAQKKKQKTVIYSIIGAVVAVCVVVLLFWDSGVIQKNATAVTVGDRKYNVVDLDYHYYNTLASYSSYADLYGLDLEAPLDEQEIYEGYTWDQMLKDAATESLTSIALLSAEADKAGYELTQDGKDQVAMALMNIEAYSTLYGVSEEYYLQTSYGKYMNLKEFERILTEVQRASEYGQLMMDGMEASEEDIQAFYKENSSELDTIDYDCYLVSFDTTTKDADGNTVKLDETTVEANRAEAEKKAQEILDQLVAGNAAKAEQLAKNYGAIDDSNMAGISYSGFADWMADQSHGAGSYGLVENIGASSGDVIGYFAIYVNDRYLDDYPGVNIRVLQIVAGTDDDGNYLMDDCKKRADQILANLEATDKTSEDFATVYANAGGSSNYPGGLWENVSKKAFGEEVTEWIFDAGRKQGDYTLIEDPDENSYFLVYFESVSDLPYWKAVCTSNVQANMYYDWQEATLEATTVTNGFGYRFVG